MKKALSLLLCFVMLAATLASCVDLENEDKGATIPIYLSGEVRTLDPAYAHTDDAAIKVLGLIFEGLTKVESNGKIVGAAAESWTYKSDPKDDYYLLEFKLKETAWSDGRFVSSDDFVYAWKRIMEPEFQSEGAAMLYDIKNAKDVKLGDCSIDDLGVYAADTYVLQVQFERDIDVDRFLRYCASPLLVPLREDSVNRVENWSTNSTTIVTNGPFTVRNFVIGSTLVLERNQYYRRDVERDSVKKYVTPYRLQINFGNGADGELVRYNEDKIMYIGELALADRAEYKKEVKLLDSMYTHTYYFNTTRAPFDNADVRRGLSMAIDREALAEIIVFAKAATGMVNGNGVFEDSHKKSFASVSGSLISSSADMAEAKRLTANASEKSFTVTIRANEVDRAVAEYCRDAWKELGFDVKIEELEAEKYMTESEYYVYEDEYSARYSVGDYDVIAVDWLAASNDASSLLYPFAKQFSGTAKNLVAGEFEDKPHITGYNNPAYDAKIDEAFNASDEASRLALMHEAEKILVEDMPVMPLFTYQNYYMKHSDISGLKFAAWYGYTDFSKVKFKNFEDFEMEVITVSPGEA